MADPRVIMSPFGATVAVVGYTSNTDRFNFSLTTQKDVHVKPTDDDGNIIEEGKPVVSVVHRSYNIVRDGELVMNELLASMSEKTFNDLREAGVINAKATYEAGKSYTLSLGDMKMVSSAWARPSSLRLVNLLREIEDLKVEQKALNAHIMALGKPETPEFDGNVYRERSVRVEEAAVEHYTAPLVEVRLMGYKPSGVADVPGLTIDQAVVRVKLVRQRLRAARFLARSIVFACHLTGWQSINWGPIKVANSGKQEQLATLSGAQLKLVTGEELVAAS